VEKPIASAAPDVSGKSAGGGTVLKELLLRRFYTRRTLFRAPKLGRLPDGVREPH